MIPCLQSPFRVPSTVPGVGLSSSRSLAVRLYPSLLDSVVGVTYPGDQAPLHRQGAVVHAGGYAPTLLFFLLYEVDALIHSTRGAGDRALSCLSKRTLLTRTKISKSTNPMPSRTTPNVAMTPPRPKP